MPLYEYACKKCHAEFELLVRAESTPECPECHSRDLEQHLSVPAAPNVMGTGMSGKALPIVPQGGGCGRPQCGSGKCMFDN